jgi:hypothetical protein
MKPMRFAQIDQRFQACAIRPKVGFAAEFLAVRWTPKKMKT